MSKLVGVGKVDKSELGISYHVVRTRDGRVQKWADVVLEESANQIASEGNAREDGWTYEVRRARV